MAQASTGDTGNSAEVPVGLQTVDATDKEMGTVSSLSNAEAVTLGMVEGLTEYLPVSSTGHLILVDQWMRKGEALNRDTEEARNAYLIVIQGGAILAVLFLYWRKLLGILMGLLGRNPEGLSLGLKVGVAFIPAALTGPFLNDIIESRLFNPSSVAIALILGAIAMLLVEWRRKTLQPAKTDATAAVDVFKTIDQLSYRGALAVGLMQCLAMWPGMSRSMVTIVGGYFVGLSAKSAAEFSFLLGFLTLSAASVYSLLGSWHVMVSTLEPGPALLGLVVATIVAFVAVKWFVGFLSKHGLTVFAYYRLILAVVILWIVR